MVHGHGRVTEFTESLKVVIIPPHGRMTACLVILKEYLLDHTDRLLQSEFYWGEMEFEGELSSVSEVSCLYP